MYRPASNWNGHRPDRRPTGAQRELVRSLGTPSPAPAAPYTFNPTPVVAGQRSMPLPAWVPDCDE